MPTRSTGRSLLVLAVLLVSSQPDGTALTPGEVVTNVTDLPNGLLDKAVLFRNLDGSPRVIDRSTTVVDNGTTVWLELREDDANPYRIQVLKSFIDSTKAFLLPRFELAGADLQWTRIRPRNVSLSYDIIIAEELTSMTDTVHLRVTEEGVPWTLPGLMEGNHVFGFGQKSSIWLNRTEALWWTATRDPPPQFGDSPRHALHVMFEPAFGRSNRGSEVWLNKTWLRDALNITRPYVEWTHTGTPWLPLTVNETPSHFIVHPQNFSTIGVHEAANGLVDFYVQSKTDEGSLRVNSADFLSDASTYLAASAGADTTFASGSVYRYRQRFTLQRSGYLESVYVHADSTHSGDPYSLFFTVDVYSDTSGVPGTLLDRGAPGFHLGNTGDGATRRASNFYNSTLLSAGSTYWFVVHAYASGASRTPLGMRMSSAAGNAVGGCEMSSDTSDAIGTGTWFPVSVPSQYCRLDTYVRDSSAVVGSSIQSRLALKKWVNNYHPGNSWFTFAPNTLMGFRTDTSGFIGRIDVPMGACSGTMTFNLHASSAVGHVGSFLASSSSTEVLDNSAQPNFPMTRLWFDPPVSMPAGTYVLHYASGPTCSGGATGLTSVQSGWWTRMCQSSSDCESSTWWDQRHSAIRVWEAYYPSVTAVSSQDMLPANVNDMYAGRVSVGGDACCANVEVTNGASTITVDSAAPLTTFPSTGSSVARFKVILGASASAKRTVNFVDYYYTREIQYTNALTRTVGTNSETNAVSATATEAWNTALYKVAVTNKAQAITSATPGTSQLNTCPSDPGTMTSNQWCFDSTGFFVYIKKGSLASGTSLTANVQATWGGTFDITVPGFVRSGEYIMTIGVLRDASGNPLNGIFANMEVLDQAGGTLPNNIGKGPSYYVQNGNFFAIQTTNYLPPSKYVVQVSFTDSGTGFVTKRTYPITIGRGDVGTGGGGGASNPIYTDGHLYYKFFDNRTGAVLNDDFYKVYVSTDATIDESDRVVGGSVPVYVGTRLYFAVRDYFGHQVFPPPGGYLCTTPDGGACPFAGQTSTSAYLDVKKERTFFDVGITLYQVKVKNTQTEPTYLQLSANGKLYQTYALPGEVLSLSLPQDTYGVQLDVYDSDNPSRLMDYAYMTDAGASRALDPGARPHFLTTTTWPATGVATASCETGCSAAPTDVGGVVHAPGDACIDSVTTTSSYCQTTASSTGAFEDHYLLGTLDLARVAKVNRLALALWDGDARYYYGFRVDVSADPDHDGWETLYDSKHNGCAGGRPPGGGITRTGATRALSNYCGPDNVDYQGVQTLSFSPLDIRYVRIFGTGGTAGSAFQVRDISAEASATTSITVDRDTFLWVRGYDLYSVVFAVNNVGAQVYNQQVNVGVHIQNQDSTIQQQTASIRTFFDNTESFVGTQLVGIWSGVNNTQSTVTTQLNGVSQQIVNQNSNLSTQFNSLASSVDNSGANVTTQLNSVSQQVLNLNASMGTQFNSVHQEILNQNASLALQFNNLASEVLNNGIRPAAEPELRGYWSLDHANGSTEAEDRSRYRTNAQLSNSLMVNAWEAGRFGNAIRLDGTTQHLRVPDAPHLDPTVSVSVETWVRFDTVTKAHQAVLVKEGGPFRLQANGSSLTWTLTHADDATSFLSTAPGILRPNEWQFLSATWRPGWARILLDGEEAASAPAGTLPLKASPGDLHLGRSLADPQAYCACSLDEVRLYGRELEPNEVQAHHRGLAPELFSQFNVINSGVTNSNLSIGTQLNVVRSQVTNAEANLTAQMTLVSANVTTVNSTVVGQANLVQAQVQNLGANVSTQLNEVSLRVDNSNASLHEQFNIVGARVENLNASVVTQFNLLSGRVENSEANITQQVNLLEIQIENVNASLGSQVNAVRIRVQNGNASIHEQLNTLLAEVSNSNVTLLEQVNLVHASVENLNATVHTQFNGATARIDVFESNVNTSFALIQSNITYTESVILENVTDMNATLAARMVNVLDGLEARGSDAFNQTTSILQNLTSSEANLSSRIVERALTILDDAQGKHEAVYNQTLLILANLLSVDERVEDTFSLLRGNHSGASLTYLEGLLLEVQGDLENATASEVAGMVRQLVDNITRWGFLALPNIHVNDTTPPATVLYASPSLEEVGVINVGWASSDTQSRVTSVRILGRREGRDWTLLVEYGMSRGIARWPNAIAGASYEFKAIAMDDRGNEEPDPAGPGNSNYARLDYAQPASPFAVQPPTTKEEVREGLLQRPLLVPGPTAPLLILGVALLAWALRPGHKKTPPRTPRVNFHRTSRGRP